MASLQFFGRGGIPPPTSTGALRSYCSRPAMPGDMEATPPSEDPYFRLATRTLPSDDESHAPRLVPGAVVNCPLCDGEIEDCSHLFITCPMVQEAWRTSGVARLTASSDEEFWSSS